jgi:hypothetical protein
MRQLLFNLPLLLPSLNVTLRDHWSSRHDLAVRLNQEVMAAIGGPRHYPQPPFERARVIVTRHCHRPLDDDNLAGSLKSLVDVLKAHHPKRNPLGLSFIVGDDPARCQQVPRQVQEKHRTNQWTIVVVEELPAVNAAELDLSAEAGAVA